MITKEEMHSAIVTLEQHIKDCEAAKETDKHNPEQLKKWSAQMFDSKVKLQVLHYAQGLTHTITEETLHRNIRELKDHIHGPKSPREVDLFIAEDEKEIAQRQRIMELKLFTLNFIAGIERKII